jgi:hypothetical protein
MVITDQFVYIHKPKTGGTFVTDALLKLYNGRWNSFIHAKLALLKAVRFSNHLGTLVLTADKHGGCRHIPESQLNKSLVTTIRNPFDYYVSQYEFGWWKRKEWLRYYQQFETFANYRQHFPDLSFRQFMELMTLAFNKPPHHDFNNPQALGRNTIEFIESCFYHPEIVIARMSKDYVSSGAYRSDMFPVEFLFTHRLNQELFAFLLRQGYPEEEIAFIKTKEKVLPQGKGRTIEQKWERYYTPELKDLVRKKDWFLFELFPEFKNDRQET